MMELNLRPCEDFPITQGQIANQVLAGQVGPILTRAELPEVAHRESVHDMAVRWANLDRHDFSPEMLILQCLKLVPCDRAIMFAGPLATSTSL